MSDHFVPNARLHRAAWDCSRGSKLTYIEPSGRCPISSEEGLLLAGDHQRDSQNHVVASCEMPLEDFDLGSRFLVGPGCEPKLW